MAQLKPLSTLRLCQNHLASSHLVLPHRNVWFKPDGKGMTKKRNRIRAPVNWRDVNFNPAKIPSAWKPKDYDERNRIDYEHEKELAKHIPGYKPKIRPEEEANYHHEVAYVTDGSHTACFGLNQVLSLTKSYVVERQLPQPIQLLMDQLWTEEQNQSVLNVMERAHLYDFDPDTIHRNRKRRHIIADIRGLKLPPLRKCNLMGWEFVRLSNIRGFQLKSFDAMKRMLVENSPIIASFERANVNLQSEKFNIPGLPDSWRIQFKSSPTMQALSQNPLGLFANGEEVDRSRSADVADIYPALPISDIPTTNHYDFVNKTGFAASAQLPHIHTLLEYNTEDLSDDDFHGNMFKSLFASLHSRAREIYGNEVGELKQPLSAQCIGLDGRMFHFMCLQLNSTSFESDEGVKNMVWLSEPIPLFEQCSHTTWQNSDYYTEYNPQAFQTFQAMWLNGLTI